MFSSEDGIVSGFQNNTFFIECEVMDKVHKARNSLELILYLIQEYFCYLWHTWHICYKNAVMDVVIQAILLFSGDKSNINESIRNFSQDGNWTVHPDW